MVSETTRGELIEMMVGRSLESEFPKHAAQPGQERLRVEGLTREPVVRDASFRVRDGEVLGFAGLVGAGRTEIMRMVFGADRPDRGRIFIQGREVTIRDPRDESSLDRFWRTLTPEHRAGVEAVSMDMWEAFRNSTLRYVPGAAEKIVYDNFHLARYVNRAVDEVRRMEHQVKEGDKVSPLKGTRQLWLYGLENVPPKWAARFRELRALATKTARAWKVKELFRSFWACGDEEEATAFFRDWYREAMATRLEPVKKVARMFKRHWANIVTYFRHHLSNAHAEGINSRIQHIIQQACGFRNRARFKRDIMFHLGGLDLHPVIIQ